MACALSCPLPRRHPCPAARRSITVTCSPSCRCCFHAHPCRPLPGTAPQSSPNSSASLGSATLRQLAASILSLDGHRGSASGAKADAAAASSGHLRGGAAGGSGGRDAGQQQQQQLQRPANPVSVSASPSGADRASWPGESSRDVAAASFDVHLSSGSSGAAAAPLLGRPNAPGPPSVSSSGILRRSIDSNVSTAVSASATKRVSWGAGNGSILDGRGSGGGPPLQPVLRSHDPWGAAGAGSGAGVVAVVEPPAMLSTLAVRHQQPDQQQQQQGRGRRDGGSDDEEADTPTVSSSTHRGGGPRGGLQPSSQRSWPWGAEPHGEQQDGCGAGGSGTASGAVAAAGGGAPSSSALADALLPYKQHLKQRQSQQAPGAASPQPFGPDGGPPSSGGGVARSAGGARTPGGSTAHPALTALMQQQADGALLSSGGKARVAAARQRAFLS